MLVIKIAELGSTVKEVALADHQNSVGDALDAAGVDVGHRELRVGGQPATRSTNLSNGDLITLIPAVKGGGCRGRKFRTVFWPWIERYI